MLRTKGRARRLALKQLIAAGLSPVAAWLPRRVAAMGDLPRGDGVYRWYGDVRVNGAPVNKETIVRPGDKVSTGPRSQVVVVIGEDAFLIRADTEVTFQGNPATRDAAGKLRAALIQSVGIATGKLLAVFGRGQKRVALSNAVIGVRGTGIYFESDPERSYICTCYGTVEIAARADATVSEVVSTQHHEAPRYVYAAGSKQLIEKAPVINHSDDELFLLEWYVGREPPFPRGYGY